MKLNRWTASFGGAASLGIGLVLGLAIASNGNPDWWEVAGTWLGSIGTVLAILWALHVFTVEQRQARRAEAQKLRNQIEAASALEQAELRAQAELAGSVHFLAVNGAGFDRGPDSIVNEVMFDVVNRTDELLQGRIWLEGHEDREMRILVNPKQPFNARLGDVQYTVPYGFLTPRLPFTTARSFLEYTIGGVTWVRESGGQPRRAGTSDV